MYRLDIITTVCHIHYDYHTFYQPKDDQQTVYQK